MNDIDIEYGEAVSKANTMARIKRKYGICFHGSIFTNPEVVCGECSKVFQSTDALYAERDELLQEWL